MKNYPSFLLTIISMILLAGCNKKAFDLRHNDPEKDSFEEPDNRADRPAENEVADNTPTDTETAKPAVESATSSTDTKDHPKQKAKEIHSEYRSSCKGFKPSPKNPNICYGRVNETVGPILIYPIEREPKSEADSGRHKSEENTQKNIKAKKDTAQGTKGKKRTRRWVVVPRNGRDYVQEYKIVRCGLSKEEHEQEE